MSEKYALIINGERYEVDVSELTGAQIRALAGLDPVIDLVLESVSPDGGDHVLADNEKINLTKATVRAFTRPPTSFGIAPN